MTNTCIQFKRTKNRQHTYFLFLRQRAQITIQHVFSVRKGIMPVVHVNMWKGMKQENVKTIIQKITKVFVEMGIPEEAVEVLVHEVPQSHWGIGGTPASEKFKSK